MHIEDIDPALSGALVDAQDALTALSGACSALGSSDWSEAAGKLITALERLEEARTAMLACRPEVSAMADRASGDW